MFSKKILAVVFFFLMFTLLYCQENRINYNLKDKLEYILLKDQGVRAIIENDFSQDEIDEWLKKVKLTRQDIEGSAKFNLMRKFDSINLIEIESIISKYGYPSKNEVGDTNKAIFYVIQHSNKIDKYLPLFRKASENGDLKKTALAMMEDRNLMEKGLPQIYGTQVHGRPNKKGVYVYIVWPIKNPDSVNIRRKEIGFTETVEKYAEQLDVKYKVYSIDQLNTIWQ